MLPSRPNQVGSTVMKTSAYAAEEHLEHGVEGDEPRRVLGVSACMIS
jgi:hypothetical protein